MARQRTVLRQPLRPLRVTRRQARVDIGCLRKTHRPEGGRIGYPSPQFAVDEIADAPRSQAERHQRRDKVEYLQPLQTVFAGEQPACRHHAEKAAVKRHAAVPHLNNVGRVRQIIFRLVKQHETEPPAEDDAEHAPGEEIVEHFIGKRRAALFDAAAAEPHKKDKADNIAERVPADGKRPELEGNGIELRVDNHVKHLKNKRRHYTQNPLFRRPFGYNRPLFNRFPAILPCLP